MTARERADQIITRLFRASPTAFLVLAPDTPRFTITEVNDAYLAATMRTREGLIGLPLFEAFPDNPADLDADGVSNLRASLERVLATRLPDAMPAQKYDIARPDGGFEERWWTPVNSAVLDEDGALEALLHHVTDVTEQRRADAALRQSEARARGVLDGMTEGLVLLDREFRILEINAEGARLEERSREEIVGRSYWEVWPGIEESELGLCLKQAMATRAPCNLENGYTWPDGSEAWFEVQADPVEDGLAVFYRDVTERKQAEQRRLALVELSDRISDVDDPDDLAYAASEILGRTLGVSRVGYATIDPDAETLHVARDWNAASVQSLAGVLRLRDYGSFVDSLKRGEFISIPDVRQDDRTASAAEALERRSVRSFVNAPVIERGRLGAVLYVNHATVRAWSEADLALVREAAERTRTAMERLRAEGELRHSERRLRQLNETLEQRVAERTAERDRMWDTSPDLMLIIDFDGVFRRVSPAWTTVLGYASEDLVGRHVNAFVIPEDHRLTTEAYELAARGGRPAIENRYRHKDGSVRWISWVAARAGDMIYATGRDVTTERAREAELEAAQEQLRQSQKMEAMGSLTGGVAHDFNNLLTPIVGALDMLQRKGLGGEREQRLIAGAIQSADRAKTLVQRLLAFARRQPLQATGVDLALLVRGMAELVSSTTGPQIKVVVDAAEGLPSAKADPNQLEMAILNLAVNARDAMPEGGTLRISVDAETVGRQHRADLKPGRYLLLSVADTGGGMDEATIKRAVEPFFSTKGIGKGTGLGLSMVHGLASQLGGALTIRSTPGVGTNVELWLPQTAEPLVRPEPASELAMLSNGSGTALLVDDEDLVRLSTADMLIELGYTVVEAASAEEALRLIDRGLMLDLLVTDHLMPGMSGTELARTLRSSRPSAKVLIVSGYAETEGIAPDLPRLTKPFRNADLAASLAALD